MPSTFVIAEAGVNHNGNVDMALRLVDAAAEAGADAVKFQTFRADEVATGDAPKADYQTAATGGGESQAHMLRRLELPRDAYGVLKNHAEAAGLVFLSTPFDVDSLAFLTDGLGLGIIKLPSGEIVNGPLLLATARTGRRIILSTGMSTLDEVRDALSVIAFGYAGEGAPSKAAFRAAFESTTGRAALKENVSLLQCTSEYPAPAADANLKAMDTLRDTFGLAVGLSDHTEGIAVAAAAVARGAAIIEKHFTLDRGLPGPDHRASLEPAELKDMVGAIRVVEVALGDGVKAPRPSELGNRVIARRSLVALRPVAKGEPFTEQNLGAKRPGGGVSPMDYWEWLGKPCPITCDADRLLILDSQDDQS